MTMKKWQGIALWVLGTAAVTYGMIYIDVIQRAKESYLQGEKYMRWADHPEEKAKEVDQQFERDKRALDAKLSKGSVSKEEYDRDLDLLQFDREQSLKESSVKYAYVWFQTAAELFSPPESEWVKKARVQMPVAKERWKSELRAKKIPFEDYMID